MEVLFLASSCEGLISRHSGTLEFTIFIEHFFFHFWFVAMPENELITSSCEDSILCVRDSWIFESDALKGRCFF